MPHHIIGYLARQCRSYADDIWLVDSTPVECGRSRETAKRSNLASWAEYGYCARVLQHTLALTATTWHNEATNQPGPARSLTAYDH